jgi:epoxyqueuosine reductase
MILERTAAVKARGKQLGFAHIGVAPATTLTDDYAHYESFVDTNMHGSMQYLAQNREARRTLWTDHVLNNAQSIVVCAVNYRTAEPDDAGFVDGRIARYARGADYHNFVRRKLRKLAAFIRQEFGGSARPMIDTAPVLERAWARRAGVGFVGKNGMLIVPGLGSYVLLGEVVTTTQLAADLPMESRCGQCTLCLSACPTAAFAKPYVLDARKCIAYLTIESAEAPPVALRSGIGDRVFGCDHCQDVCPYNHGAAAQRVSEFAQFALLDRFRTASVDALLTLTQSECEQLVASTPLSRPGPDGLARNAAIVLGNKGSKRHLPVLSAAAAQHASAVVRECAQWAIEQITIRDKSQHNSGLLPLDSTERSPTE